MSSKQLGCPKFGVILPYCCLQINKKLSGLKSRVLGSPAIDRGPLPIYLSKKQKLDRNLKYLSGGIAKQELK